MVNINGKEYTKIGKIGSGFDGTVIKVQDSNGKKYALKIYNGKRKNLEPEASICASEVGLGPKVYDHEIKDGRCHILMEMLTGPVYIPMKLSLRDIYEMLKSQYYFMKNYEIDQGDLRDKNIVYHEPDNKWYFIDYGTSSKLKGDIDYEFTNLIYRHINLAGCQKYKIKDEIKIANELLDELELENISLKSYNQYLDDHLGTPSHEQLFIAFIIVFVFFALFLFVVRKY